MSQTKAQLVEGLNINPSAPASALSIDASGNINLDSNTLYVDASTNRVGLGTSSPSTTLSVAGGISGTAGMNISGAGWGVLPYVANSLVIDNNAGEARFFATGANATTRGSFIFYNGETDGGAGAAMVIDTSSRVGIGSTPARTLHVFGETALSNSANTGTFLFLPTASANYLYSRAADGSSTAVPFVLSMGSTEALRLDSSGRLLVGTSSVITNAWGGTGGLFQVAKNDFLPIGLFTYSSTAADGYCPYFELHRARGSQASPTIVSSGDELGEINFYGHDGSTFTRGASIRSYVDGTPGANDMPGRLVFSTTADAASSPTERMRISANGDVNVDSGTFFVDAVNNRVGVGTTSPNSQLSLGSPGGTAALTLVDTSVPLTIATFSQSSSGEIKIGGVNTLGTYHLAFHTQNTERARIDGSGRLLVGTSSAPTGSSTTYAKLVVRGNTATSGESYLVLGRNSAASADQPLGSIWFADNADGQFARIEALCDGTPGASDFPGRLTFSTTADSAASPTERMRITNLGITSVFSSNQGFNSRISSGSAASEEIFLGRHSATDTTDGTLCFYVSANGDVSNTNDVYQAISDIKLKENIVDAGSQWDDFKAVRFRKFNFKEETGHETFTQLGVIAQELELVSPGLVTERPDRDDAGNDLGTTTKSVKYSILTKKALVALQEAMDRIEQLEAKVAALEAS